MKVAIPQLINKNKTVEWCYFKHVYIEWSWLVYCLRSHAYDLDSVNTYKFPALRTVEIQASRLQNIFHAELSLSC